jgi:YQGE family putative transporter
VIELVSAAEKRDHFAYIFNHELGLYAGRLAGCLLFIALARFISEDFALRYALLFVAAVLFFSAFVAKSIISDKTWYEPQQAKETAVYELKEPIEL